MVPPHPHLDRRSQRLGFHGNEAVGGAGGAGANGGNGVGGGTLGGLRPAGLADNSVLTITNSTLDATSPRAADGGKAATAATGWAAASPFKPGRRSRQRQHHQLQPGHRRRRGCRGAAHGMGGGVYNLGAFTFDV